MEGFKSGKSTFVIDGALGPLLKHFLKAALKVDMDLHLGTEQRRQGNSPNGKASKQVRTSDGTIEVEISRDRSTSFEPQIIRKWETVLGNSLEPHPEHVRFGHEPSGHLHVSLCFDRGDCATGERMVVKAAGCALLLRLARRHA